MRSSASRAGLGTLDEVAEALTLIQTGKVADFPVVLLGADYWQPLLRMLEQMARDGAISEDDLDLLLVTDSVDDAMAHIHGARHRRVRSPCPAARATVRPARRATGDLTIRSRVSATCRTLVCRGERCHCTRIGLW